MNDLERKIIEQGLGENGLPVKARMGEDPGHEYFSNLIADLKTLCAQMSEKKELNKELSYALYCLGHFPYVEYSLWVSKGRKFRDDLFDPQIFQLEMAVESVFVGEWMSFLNEL